MIHLLISPCSFWDVVTFLCILLDVILRRSLDVNVPCILIVNDGLPNLGSSGVQSPLCSTQSFLPS